jgi:hypothetical protein
MNYTALDDAIVAEIEAGNNTRYTLDIKLRSMAIAYATDNRYLGLPARTDRIITRRLQAMRKDGRLAYEKGVWRKVK